MDKVLFLIERDGTDIFAFFPELIADRNGNFTLYSHVGQHSACSMEYARKCKVADHYRELAAELSSIGYSLDILNTKLVEYSRKPTPYEIKLGYGAIHYKDFTFSEVLKWDKSGPTFKKSVKCPVTGLIYTR